MINNICRDILVSVCTIFDNGIETEFGEAALKIFMEKLESSRGYLFAFEDDQLHLLKSAPDSGNDTNKNVILSSLLKSSFSGGSPLPSRLTIGNENYNVIPVKGYGLILLLTDNNLSGEIISGLKPATDHLGSLLTVFSDTNRQKLRNLVYKNLAFVASRTTDIILITDHEGFVTYVNDSFIQKTGYAFSESLGRRPSELIHGPETDPTAKKRMLEAILEHRSIKEEILNYSKIGEKFWLQINIDPVFDEHGECIAYVSVGRDISQRKVTDRELIHKENMLRAIAACSNEFLINTDLIDAVNKSLPVIGQAVDVDRVYFFRNSLIDGSKLVTSQISEWNSGTSKPQIDNQEMQNIPIEIIDIFLPDFYKHKPVSAIISQLPPDLEYRKMLESQDVKSLLLIPIFSDSFFWGIVGFDECRDERIWAEDEISLLQYYCLTVTNAVERARVTDELMNLYLFPKESPLPLVRIDLAGNVIMSNEAADAIRYFRLDDEQLSFTEFFMKVATEINQCVPQKKYEVNHEDQIYQVMSVLSSNRIHINNYVNDITDLKKYQLELERLSLVAMNYKQGVHFTGPDLNVTYANKAMERITGYSLEEMIGKTPVELFHGPLTQPDQSDKLFESHLTVSPVDVDNILYRKDRSWFWANIKKQPLKKKDKYVQEFFSIIEDITEKKLAEENLRNSETRIQELIRNLKEGILLENEDRNIIITNSTFCRMFGIDASPDDLIGANCASSAEEAAPLMKDPEAFVNRLRIIIEERHPALNEELELINGSFYERDYIPILIDNELRGHLWKYSDISERKNRERALSQQEEKYRNIIANMKMGLLETDTFDVVTYVNQEFCEMSGYSRSEIIGTKSVDLLVDDEYKEVVRQKYSIREAGISDIYPIQVKLRNGESRWWLTSGGPNFNDDGELTGTIGISVDISDQKRLEKELEISKLKAEESSRAKEAFLASMSHEIRTPLNVIIGMIRELARESLTERQQIYIRNAEMASHHLLSIVNDVLDITKIASGQINLDLGAFSLTELINDIIKMLTPESDEKMLNLSTNVSLMLAPIYIGDANRIKQILINIISNSIKFTDTGGISVECSLISKVSNIHQIRLKITDTGIGMDEAFLDHIFDKFSQGDYSSARKAGGTGLGMAITYELVRMMKGHISVSSKKGFGTTTEITLDMEVGSIEEIRTSIVSESFEDLKDRKILLVEDSDLNRLVALNSLNYYGLRVTEATNGYEAVERMKESSYDAILMDLQMPVMGGLEATRIIREELKLSVPIIALTAHSFKAEIDRCLEVGMNDYIIKPFEEHTLMSVIVRNIKKDKEIHVNESEEQPSAPISSKLYSLEAIIKMSRGNSEFIKRIIQVFIEQTPAAVEEIKNAWSNSDLDTIRRVAHKIKPNLDNFGISDLKQEIRAIESLAEEGVKSPELESRIKKLDTIIRAVVSDLAYEIF